VSGDSSTLIAAHAGPFGPHLLSVAHDSFTTAVTTGFTVAGAIAVAAALVTAAALPRRTASAHRRPGTLHAYATTSPV
jgi:hypothetical protein